MKEKKDIKKSIQKTYGDIAKTGSSCCCSCSCDGTSANAISQKVGYTEQDMSTVPEGANLGLGCGNPVALADIKPGETVLDLGSGAGFDSFLAAKRTGPTGKVIGVDMTTEMIQRANENAQKGDYKNVTFIQGEIESLPVSDGSVDIIISNCVINLSTDKPKVFREAYRVLKSGGRLMVSDIVLLKELPPEIRDSVDAYIGCLAGALLKKDYLTAMQAAGFSNIEIVEESAFPLDYILNDLKAKIVVENMKLTDEMMRVVSIKIKAVK